AMKLYIAVLDSVPDFIVPTLVAHSMLGAHLNFQHTPIYRQWLGQSFKKCVVRVNQKEFERIAALETVYLGYENKTLDGDHCCAIPLPCSDDTLPNVLRYSRLWAPSQP